MDLQLTEEQTLLREAVGEMLSTWPGTVVAVIGLALWYLATSTKSSERRRTERETKHIAHQPWDGAKRMMGRKRFDRAVSKTWKVARLTSAISSSPSVKP